MICYLGSKDCIAPEMPHSRPDSIRWSLDCTTKCGLELYRRPCQHSDFAAQPGATYPQQTLCKAEKEAVIVADSNDLSRERLIEIIQNLGYTAIGVSNAAELYEKVSEYKTGCILADLMLRGVDGLVLQEKLNRTGTSLPAIFMSDTGDVNTVVQFMKNGAFNFIIKPVSEIYLKRAVICAIDESQRRNCASESHTFVENIIAELTPTELTVARMIARGYSTQLVAAEMNRSENTVKIHRHRIFSKLMVSSAASIANIMHHLRGYDKLAGSQADSPASFRWPRPNCR